MVPLNSRRLWKLISYFTANRVTSHGLVDALAHGNSAHKPHRIAAMIVQLYTALSAKSLSIDF